MLSHTVLRELSTIINFQGTAYDSRYPFIIMCGLFFAASICSLFLPETLYQKLPDSIEEARVFGANQVKKNNNKTTQNNADPAVDFFLFHLEILEHT